MRERRNLVLRLQEGAGLRRASCSLISHELGFFGMRNPHLRQEPREVEEGFIRKKREARRLVLRNERTRANVFRDYKIVIRQKFVLGSLL